MKLTQKLIQDFREKFVSQWQFDTGADNPLWDIKAPSPKEIETFLTDALSQVEKAQIDKLIEVEKSAWGDAEHCSCLRHAIWQLMGEPEDKEFLKLINKKP